MSRGKHGNHVNSSEHYRWNQGKLRSSHGYVKIRVGKSHPLADPNGYAYEHLVVWAASGKPLPKKNQVIHHINEDKSDNRIDNLELVDRYQHSVRHHSTLSDEDVRKIRESYAFGKADMPTIAKRYGVPQQRISRIISGDTRKSAGGPILVGDKRKKKSRRHLDGREWNEMPVGGNLND